MPKFGQFTYPDQFDAMPLTKGWDKPAFADDVEKKKAFGVELAKPIHKSPLEAAFVVFGADTAAAMWAVGNWVNDPVVLGATNTQLKTSTSGTKLLDKEAFAARLLDYAVIEPEGKDRLAALKLYSEVMGFSGKVDVDASTKNFVTNNQMVVKLVRADNKEHKLINSHPKMIENDFGSPIKVKLVGNDR